MLQRIQRQRSSFCIRARMKACGIIGAVAFVSLLAGGAAHAEIPPCWPACAAMAVAQNGPPLWAAGQNPDSSNAEKGKGNDTRIDTEHIFGFAMGSDIGEKGEFELESENIAGFGRRTGSYFALSGLQLLKYTVTDDFRVAPGFIINSNRIRGVEGFEDITQTGIGGAVVELRYKLIDRQKAPFGLTLHLQPGWSRLDEATGLGVEQYSNEFAALFDKEIIKDRLWGTINIGYGMAASRFKNASEWAHDSDLSFQAAASYQVFKGLLLGGEVRYVRGYEGLGLDRFRGDALYVGPTFSTNITGNIGLSGAVNVKVAGKSIGNEDGLELANFERVKAMLRLNVHF